MWAVTTNALTSVCSMSNDVCCTDCQITPKSLNKECESGSDNTCKEASYCDGLSASCNVNYKSEGTVCQKEL